MRVARRQLVEDLAVVCRRMSPVAAGRTPRRRSRARSASAASAASMRSLAALVLEIADGIDHHVAEPQQLRCSLRKRHAAHRVAAVGVEQQDVLAVARRASASRYTPRRRRAPCCRPPSARGSARTAAGSLAGEKRPTRTVESKSTNVTSTASSSASTNCTAAVAAARRSCSMLSLVSSSRPRCSGSAVARRAFGEERDRLRPPSSRTSKSAAVEAARPTAPSLPRDDDRQADEVDRRARNAAAAPATDAPRAGARRRHTHSHAHGQACARREALRSLLAVQGAAVARRDACVWRAVPYNRRCACAGRLSGRAGHPDPAPGPDRRLRHRVPGREPPAGPASRRRRRLRSPSPIPSASTPTSAPTSRPTPASSSRTTASASLKRIVTAIRDAGGSLLYILHVDGAGPNRRRPRRAARGRPGNHASRPGGAARADPDDRARPVADPRARAAVPALLRRRRSRADPAAQRAGPRRARRRPGAAQRAAPDADDGDHRRAAGRDAARRTCGWPTCSTSRSKRSRPESSRLRSHRDGRRAAALLRRAAAARRPGRRPSSRAAGLHGGLQGHPRRLRVDVHDPDRASARRRRQHLRAHGDGDALRDQVGHAVLRAPDQPRRPRGVHVPLSAGRPGADPQDGRRGNHARAAGARDARARRRAGCGIRCSRRSSARPRARTSSPTPPTSCCRSRTSSGRSSPASSAASSSSACATSATRATPASS